MRYTTNMLSPLPNVRGRSPAIQLIDHVWRHTCGVGDQSWDTINHALSGALRLAVCGRLGFSAGDFDLLCDKYRAGHWISSDGGEWAYSLAAESGNESACQAFENHMKRPRFIVLGSRMCVGRDFFWDSERHTCTSFAKDGQSLVACSYDMTFDKRGYCSLKKITRRRRFTIELVRLLERTRTKELKLRVNAPSALERVAKHLIEEAKKASKKARLP